MIRNYPGPNACSFFTFIMFKLSGGNLFSYTNECFQFIKYLICTGHFNLASESAHHTKIVSRLDNVG